MNAPRTRHDLLVVILLTVIAFALRCRELGDPLWLDELHTAWSVTDGAGSVAGRAAAGNHAPVTFYLGWLSTRCFGENRFALRLPSLLAGTLLVPVIYIAMLGATGATSCAWMAAVLAMFDYFGLLFSQEARPYAVVTLLAVLQTFVFLRCARARAASGDSSQKWLRLSFVVLSLLLVYSHYATALHLAAIGFSWLFLMLWQRRCFLFLEFLVIAACCLPALPQLAAIAARRTNWTFIESNQTLSVIVEQYRLDVVAVLPWLVCLLVWLTLRKNTPRQPRRASAAGATFGAADLVVLIAWAVVPLAAAWLLTVTDIFRLFYHRYTISSSMGTICLGSAALAVLPRGGLSHLFAAALTATIIGLSGVVPACWEGSVHDRRENWREMAEIVRARDPLGTSTLFLCPGLIEDIHLDAGDDPRLREYCLFPLNGFYDFPQAGDKQVPRPTTTGAVSDAAIKRIRSEKGAWFLIRGSEKTRLAIRGALQKSLPSARIDVETYGTLTLIRVSLVE